MLKKDSLGKLSRFVDNPREPRNFCRLTFVAYGILKTAQKAIGDCLTSINFNAAAAVQPESAARYLYQPLHMHALLS